MARLNEIPVAAESVESCKSEMQNGEVYTDQALQ